MGLAAARLLLQNYPAFAYLWPSALARFRPHLLRINAAFAATFAVLLFTGAWFEDALILPGPSVGLLEHPGIILFLISHWLIPGFLIRSYANLLAVSGHLDDQPTTFSLLKKYERNLIRSTCLRSQPSRWLYLLLSSIGLIAFVWNCYQNQNPERFLGFDFWDSINYPLGYGLTRVYKFYLWTLLMPAIVHIELLVLFSLVAFLRDAERGDALTLKPYHPDGCGGLRVFIDSIIFPLIPILVAAGSLTVAAFFVHKQYDFTTAGGLALTCALFCTCYIIPAFYLRRFIVAEKKRQLEEVGDLQDDIYKKLRKASEEEIRKHLETIGALGELCARIRQVPNWPQLSLVVKLTGITASSPVLGWAGKFAFDHVIDRFF